VPPADEHESAYHAVLKRLDEIAAEGRNHRDVINRAVGYLNQEVVEFARRQGTLEALVGKLMRWVIGLIAVLIVSALVAIALFIGSRWL